MASVVVSTNSGNFGHLSSDLSTLISYSSSIVPSATTLYQIENGIASDVGGAFYSVINQVTSNQIISDNITSTSVTLQTPTWTGGVYGSISVNGSNVTKWVMTDSNGDTLTLTGSLEYSGLPVVSGLISGSHIDSVTWSLPSPTTAGDSLIGSINLAAYYYGGSSFDGQVSSFSAGLIDSADQEACVTTYQTSQSADIPIDGLGASVSDGTLNSYSMGISDHTGTETDYVYVGGIALDLAATSPHQNLIQNSLAGNDVVSISGPGALNVLPVLPTQDASATAFAVYDSAANVQGNLGVLEALATQGKLASIALTDAGTPTISLTPSQQSADAAALLRIVTPVNLNVLPCFAAGTRIATDQGEIMVEHLSVGDRVRLADGSVAAVVWLGHRRVDCRRHPRRPDVLPVRIAAHAFGMGRPARDLLVSPDHAVFVDGVLIPIRYLLNDGTVRQESVASVTYWHVELPEHGVLLAEDLPVESYLDTGNRAAFANGAGIVVAHPNFARSVWQARSCAPLVTEGPARDLVYRRLVAQALALGWRQQSAGGDAIQWLPPGRRASSAFHEHRSALLRPSGG